MRVAKRSSTRQMLVNRNFLATHKAMLKATHIAAQTDRKFILKKSSEADHESALAGVCLFLETE